MKVLLGVSGGIAAYKATELVRVLQRQGVEVRVAMTPGAERFVTPLTFAALTGKRVYTSLWEPGGEGAGEEFAIEHIAATQEVDALVVAPATADLLAKFAHGLADDFLSAAYLAASVPVLVAPAMNSNMWAHAATWANVETLRARGVVVIEPGDGYLACGMTGGGRLAEVDTIAAQVLRMLKPRHDLAGETVLVTAGGTREPVDAVRFLGNRSSGKMGHALAKAAAARGAKVVLVTASSLAAPAGCEVVRVTTTAEMRKAVMDALPRATVMIGAAAVADFRPKAPVAGKLRRSGGLTLELEATEDIVAEVVARKQPGTLVIAFAAEAEALEENARSKLLRKGADAIVANDISSTEFGFDSDRNMGLFLTAECTLQLAPGTKREMAERVLDEVVRLRGEAGTVADSFLAGSQRQCKEQK